MAGLLAYALSFAYVGIYWVNHHRLFSHARRVTNGLVWFNLFLLFALSLIPFSTAYLGKHAFQPRRDAGSIWRRCCCRGLAYVPLQTRHPRDRAPESDIAQTYHRQTTRKGIVATAIYIARRAAHLRLALARDRLRAVVAILWFLPRSPIDGLFGDY